MRGRIRWRLLGLSLGEGIIRWRLLGERNEVLVWRNGWMRIRMSMEEREGEVVWECSLDMLQQMWKSSVLGSSSPYR